MSEEAVVELIHQTNDAFNRRDLDALLGLADPDIEFVPRILELEGGGPYRGHDGFRSWWESFLSVVPDFSTEIEEVRVLGATTVARTRLRGHGVGSGATMDQIAWQVAEWREKRCVRWRTFGNEAEALEAAGVSEWAMSEENVDVVRQIFEAFNNRDWDLWESQHHPDVEWSDPPEAPGGGTHRGVGAVRRSMAEFLETADDWQVEVDDVEAVGKDRVRCAGARCSQDA